MKRSLSPLAILIGISLVACSQTTAPRVVPTGTGTVFVDDGGRGGLPVVFIHGNGGSSFQWRMQLAHLRKTRRATAIDLPGFGKSSAPSNGDYSLASMASAIDASTRAVGIDRFVLVGHSYAGAVIAKYAAEHPERIAGLIYVDAAASALPMNQQQQEQFSAALRADKMKVVRGWFSPMIKASAESVRKEILDSVEQTNTEAFIGALLSLVDFDARSLIGAYRGPVLAIAAADLETPVSFQQRFPKVEVVKIRNAGHWVMLDQPDEVNVALDGFLAKLH